MPLSAGTRLGPYEIVEPLGSGGMGEVYRGTDTRLGRSVAIKVLSAGVVSSDEMRRRFEREARAIAALTHPNICTLYDVGQHDGVEYLVMELLRGETLAERIERGPIPVDEVVRIGSEIADALELAHRAGIIHRDLKPGNIVLTANGAKLLDFGLAKYAEPDAFTSPDIDAATEKRQLTTQGTIVGTFSYMAPEQLEGREVDRRADLFALGVVLFEMAPGQKPFEGRSRASLIASVLEKQPPRVSEHRPAAGALDEVIDACLRKNPDERVQSAFDVKLALGWAVRNRSDTAETPPGKPSLTLLAIAVLAIGVAALAATIAWRSHSAAAPATAIRAALPLAPQQSLGFMNEVAISPDGNAVVFRVADERSPLWLRRLSESAPLPIPETDGAGFPFWSPDSRSIGSFAGGKLKTVQISGGTPFVVCDAAGGRGGTWNRDGIIVFTPDGGSPLFKVSSHGGAATAVTAFRAQPRDMSHRFPSFLPDGKHFLFFAISAATPDNRSYGVYAGSLDSPDVRLVLDVQTNAVYSSGQLFYELQGSLVARSFDPASLQLDGEPAVVAEGVQYFRPFSRGDFSVSDDGVLAYVIATPSLAEVVRLDASGRKLGVVGEPQYQKYSSLSPQGDRVALFRFDPHTQDGDIWVVGTKQNELSRLTHEGGGFTRPVWSPDGQRILVGSDKNGFEDIYAYSTHGGTPQLFLRGPGYKFPTDWSSTGFVAFTCSAPKQGWNIWVAPAADPKKAVAFAAGAANEVDGRFSPDGRAIAYASDETGQYEQFEVYVRAFPGDGDAVRISKDGGSSPRWSRNGTELYYLRGGDFEVMRVPVVSTAPLQFGNAEALVPSRIAGSVVDSSDYDISPDGREFIVVLAEEALSRQLFIDTAWRAAAAQK